MSATPTHDTKAPEQEPEEQQQEQQDEVPKQQQKKQQKKRKPKHQKQVETFYGYSGEEDSYDEFEAYRSDPEDAEEKELPKGALPVVKSYELDLPKGKRARAQFDAEVDAIFRRIVGSKR